MTDFNRPESYRAEMGNLRFEEQLEAMSWISKNAVHHVALSEGSVIDTNVLVDSLAKELEVLTSDVYYGLQYATESGYLSHAGSTYVRLFTQPVDVQG